MIVRAKHWLKTGGAWVPAGTEFEVDEQTASDLSDCVDIVEQIAPDTSDNADSVEQDADQPESVPSAPAESVEAESDKTAAPKKRGRKKTN